MLRFARENRAGATWLVGSCAFWVLLGGAGAQETVELSEVKVTAKAVDTQEMRRNASAGKMVFGREDLDTLDAASIGELLNKLPGAGLFVDPDTSPRGRGKAPDRNMPQILVDGQPLPGGGRNPAAALRLPVELIERVEIIRNSTAEFPVLGPGGVVNLILRDVPSKQVRSAKVGLGVTGGEPGLRLEGQYGEPEGGNFGYLLSGAINSRSNAGSAEHQAQTYDPSGTPTGYQEERAERRGRDTNITLSPRFSWRLAPDQKLTVSPFVTFTEAQSDNSVLRLGSGALATQSGRDQDDQNTRRASGRLATEWKNTGAAGSETTARLMLQAEHDSVERQTRRYDTVGSLSSSTNEQTTRREQGWMVDLKRKQLLLDSHWLTGALEYRSDNSEDEQRRSGGVATTNLAKLDEVRKVAWVQDEWQLAEQHVLTPGLRWQMLDTRIEDSQAGTIARSHRSLDPSLHYLWQVTPAWNIRGSIARTTKVPFTRDLSPYARTGSGINSSGNPDRGGNPNLLPETLRSMELGVEHFLLERSGTIGFSVFDRHIEHYTQRLVQYDNASSRWIERPYNVGTAQLRGALVDFKAKMVMLGLPALTLRGNLAYTDIRMLDKVDGLGAGEGPRKSANLGLDYELAALRLTLGGNVNFVSSLDRESSATVKQWQAARRQLDLYALYKIDRQLALRFSAQNVTREARRNALEETDSSGNLIRREADWTPGLATYMLTLEAKW